MEAQRELRRKDRIERDLKEAKTLVEQKALELKTIQQNFEKTKAEVTKLEVQQKEQKVILERTLKDSDVLNTRFTKLQHDFETQVLNNDALANENALKVHELKVKFLNINCLQLKIDFFFLFFNRQEKMKSAF
jgi:hypothetical protein